MPLWLEWLQANIGTVLLIIGVIAAIVYVIVKRNEIFWKN